MANTTGPLNRQVAEELRALQRRHGVKNLELQHAAGVSKSTIIRLLWGRAEINLDQLAALCYALGTTPQEVIATALDHLSPTADLEEYLTPEQLAEITAEEERLGDDSDTRPKRRRA